MRYWKLIVLFSLLTLGIVLQVCGVLDLHQLIAFARQHVDHWWLGVLLALIQTVLFTFAMAGSSMLWVTAVLFPPGVSTVIITAGTTLGGISGYLFSEALSGEWTQKVRDSRIYSLLQREDNFLTLFALRLMPGFPHSVINYSSGLLKISFVNFIPAAALGTAVKTYVYSVLIYNVAAGETISRSIDFSTVWPLLALSFCLLGAVFLRRYLGDR